MSKKKSKKTRTQKTCTTVQDIEELLNKQPPKISMITGVIKNESHTGNITREDKERHRILSDETVKFVWNKDSNVIHDKTCSQVKKIGTKNLCTSNIYLSNKQQCPECMEKAYIRAGGNISEKDAYIKFFQRVNMDETLMRRLFVLDKAETCISNNILTVQMNGDTWKIKAIDNKRHSIELLYNNFDVQHEVRTIFDGYHRVRIGISIKDALDIMESYDWREHSAVFTVNRQIDKLVRRVNKIKRYVIKKVKLIKGFKNLLGEHAVYYIDGDNNPIERLAGIEKLSRKDTVKIFCAENTSYFKSSLRREELRERCNCKINFIPIKPGSNAVDFAIGMDAYNRCMTDPGCHIYLLSADRHFTVIKQQITAMTKRYVVVKHLKSIEDAHQADDKNKFKNIWNCWTGGIKC